jgi:hypothetical protein
MNNTRLTLCLALCACASTPPRAPQAPRIEVLVVTGGHGFQAESFFRMFDEYPDIHYVTARQDQAAEAYDRADLDTFDVLVLYDSLAWTNVASPARLRGRR